MLHRFSIIDESGSASSLSHFGTALLLCPNSLQLQPKYAIFFLLSLCCNELSYLYLINHLFSKGTLLRSSISILCVLSFGLNKPLV